MSTFMSGFGKSLGGYLSNKAAADDAAERDDAQWEKRQKKLMELEAKRVAKITYGPGPDGTVIAQPVNAAGEPIGPARPANDVERAEYENGNKERKLGFDLKQAQIEEAKTSKNKAQAEIDEMPYERQRANRQARAYETMAKGQAAQAYAQAKESKIRAAGGKIQNTALEEYLKANPGAPLPGRGGSQEKTPTPLSEKDRLTLELTNKKDELDLLADEATSVQAQELLDQIPANIKSDPVAYAKALLELKAELERQGSTDTTSTSTYNKDNLARFLSRQ